MKFERNDKIRHVKSGHEYMVIAGPDLVRLESTGKAGYIYQAFWATPSTPVWVRDAAEMEDGRFELVLKTTHGSSGRLPT